MHAVSCLSSTHANHTYTSMAFRELERVKGPMNAMNGLWLDVRNGSKAERLTPSKCCPLYPKSRHSRAVSASPLSANRRRYPPGLRASAIAIIGNAGRRGGDLRPRGDSE